MSGTSATAGRRVLLTGGAGFIGSALLHLLLRQPAAVVARAANIDKLTRAGSLRRLAAVQQDSRYALYHHDIADAAAMQNVFAREQPDAVVHLAAESHVDNSIAAPAAFMHSNVMGTYALLQAALVYWRGLPDAQQARFRLVHVSTDEVYGDWSEQEPGTQNKAQESKARIGASIGTPYRPSSPYAASKAAADHLVQAWQRTYGLPVMITHCTNNYGAWQHPEKLIPLTIRNALQGKPIPIYGDGRQQRDWLHVSDHVRGLWQVVQHGVAGQTCHFGSGRQVRNIDMVQQLCAALQEQRPRATGRYVDLIHHVQDRAGHDRLYALDCSATQAALGWQPSVDLAQGVQDTVAWALQHQDWLEQQITGAQ